MEKIFKSIYDNLYGYIKLEKTKYESILKDPFFLRLHNIKQMGLTYYVFPDALHTRYSHSLGVFFIVQKMISAQEKNYGDHAYRMDEYDKELLKVSALLHDIGHLPLSHTIELALKRYEKEQETSDNHIFEKQERNTSKSDKKNIAKLIQKEKKYFC